MNKHLTNLSTYLNGEKLLTTLQKFKVFTYVLTLLHSVHAIFFFIVGIYTLTIYNLLSILLLFGVRQMFYQKKFIKGMAPAFINIVVYSVMCTLTIGYDNNFMLYLFLIAPGSIFVTFNCDEFRHLKSYQYIMPSSMCLIFILTTIIAPYITPVFSPDLFKYKMLLQIANILWVCGIIEIFALMFSAETRRIKRELQAQNVYLDNLSRKDPLTGLLNRRSMLEEIEKSMKLAAGTDHVFSLVMCDIDNFKRINDTYGHEAGDIVIKYIANLMTESCPEKSQVSRWGGEEFLLLLERKRDTSVAIAENIRTTVCETPVTCENTNIPVSITLGVAEYIPGFDVDKIIKKADDNLYYGKTHGKNVVISSIKKS